MKNFTCMISFNPPVRSDLKGFSFYKMRELRCREVK